MYKKLVITIPVVIIIPVATHEYYKKLNAFLNKQLKVHPSHSLLTLIVVPLSSPFPRNPFTFSFLQSIPFFYKVHSCKLHLHHIYMRSSRLVAFSTFKRSTGHRSSSESNWNERGCNLRG